MFTHFQSASSPTKTYLYDERVLVVGTSRPLSPNDEGSRVEYVFIFCEQPSRRFTLYHYLKVPTVSPFTVNVTTTRTLPSDVDFIDTSTQITITGNTLPLDFKTSGPVGPNEYIEWIVCHILFHFSDFSGARDLCSSFLLSLLR